MDDNDDNTSERDQKREALRLKIIAEAKFTDSNNLKSALKLAKQAHDLCPSLDGLSSMVTAFKIIQVAADTRSDLADWYRILQVEPFSHINTIKKQYKKLALLLHPDKNPHVGCEDAFKLVGEGFRVLSDKIRRKEYDMRLRMRLQEERVNDDTSEAVDTFWTCCQRCRLLHQYERKYLGHNLVCPSCKKSFKAVEVVEREDEGKQNDGVGVGFRSVKLRGKVDSGQKSGDSGSTGKMSGADLSEKGSAGQVDKMRSGEKMASVGLRGTVGSVDEARVEREDVTGDWGGGRLRTGGLRRKMSTFDQVLERSEPKRVKFEDEMMTLAEMQVEAKKKARQEKEKLKQKQKAVQDKEKERQRASDKSKDVEIEKGGAPKKGGDLHIGTRGTRGALKKSAVDGIEKSGAKRKSTSLKTEKRKGGSSSRDLDMMAVEDSDLYDFDRDRAERSFKKGQVWAIYDDDDGMPRHYGLIDEVVSVNPFEVELSWMNLQSNGDEKFMFWEKMGSSICCGRFKIAKKTTVTSLNIFSHAVDCERAAREVYRIYPKKGSVWALYNEAGVGTEGGNSSARDGRSYDIVVFLTTYSEMHGLSMAYLEKVDGFKTVFKRREIGDHAIQFLKKDDLRLVSHQIPARKLCGDEVPAPLKECWELDPASLFS